MVLAISNLRQPTGVIFLLSLAILMVGALNWTVYATRQLMAKPKYRGNDILGFGRLPWQLQNAVYWLVTTALLGVVVTVALAQKSG